jgi:uncharacterized membrane protein YgdD (TMEM256/DUF423 family)
MSGTTWIRIGAIVGGLGVIFGAFGAHGLRSVLDSRGMEVFETAVRYQMYHAPALIAVGLLVFRDRDGASLALAGWSFLIGIVLFSGALYALALTGQRWLGMVAPIGGAALIVGWFALAIGAGFIEKTTDAEL